MIRLYLKLVLRVATIFLALSVTARALGETQPPNPALVGFTIGCEDKPQPCWYGIVPGVTKIVDVPAMLAQHQISAELDYHALYDNQGYRVSRLESTHNDCPILVSSTNNSDYVITIAFDRCVGVQLVQLRQFIFPDGSAYLWKCNHDQDGLQIAYRNILFYIENTSQIPPSNLTKVDAFTLYSDKNPQGIQVHANGQPIPLQWRYLKVAAVGSGCP
jgi:hypothetical protein